MAFDSEAFSKLYFSKFDFEIGTYWNFAKNLGKNLIDLACFPLKSSDTTQIENFLTEIMSDRLTIFWIQNSEFKIQN